MKASPRGYEEQLERIKKQNDTREKNVNDVIQRKYFCPAMTYTQRAIDIEKKSHL